MGESGPVGYEGPMGPRGIPGDDIQVCLSSVLNN